MENEERRKIADFYDSRVREHGDSPQAVGWKSKLQQRLRFDVMVQWGVVNLGRVLDLGCGSGDLLDYLQSRGLDYDAFYGIDLSPLMVRMCQDKHSEEKAIFLVQDILDIEIEEKFDTVLMSGALNFKTGQPRIQRLEALFTSIWKVSAPGAKFAVNFLSANVDYEAEINQHYEKSETLAVAQRFASSLTLIEDYGLYEFTLIGTMDE